MVLWDLAFLTLMSVFWRAVLHILGELTAAFHTRVSTDSMKDFFYGEEADFDSV